MPIPIGSLRTSQRHVALNRNEHRPFGLSKLSSGKILHWVIVMYFLHSVCLHILLSYLFGLKRFKNLQGGHVLQIKLSTSDMEKTIPDHSIWHYIYASSHLSLLSFFDLPVKYHNNAHEYQNNSPQTDSNIQNKWLYAKKNIHSAIIVSANYMQHFVWIKWCLDLDN